MAATYECLILGGGIAGLQAAIQLGRYGRRTLVVDAGTGRSTLARGYRNVLGWPDGISGNELRTRGREHAQRFGVDFVNDEILEAGKEEHGFTLKGRRQDGVYRGQTLLFATGLLDRFPPLPGLVPCYGKSVYVCPDCDGYEVGGKLTAVLGTGEVGARMALSLRSRTDRLVFINHELQPVHSDTERRLAEAGIVRIDAPIVKVLEKNDGMISGVVLHDGRVVDAERGFIAFGGNEIRSELAKQLGVERLENRHITADPRTRETNVPNVFAAGDVGAHAEQVAVAMGEGALAAVWMNKVLAHRTGQMVPPTQPPKQAQAEEGVQHVTDTSARGSDNRETVGSY